jgi:DNA-binding NtrC family response regulator
MSEDQRPPDGATRTLAGPRTLALPKVRLKVLKGPDKGAVVTLEQDEILIGGADGAHLRLTDPTVSRNHCIIRLTAKGPLLRDLASTNGSRIEGVEVREAFVPRRATLDLGHTQVRFETLDESVELPLADSERFGRLWGRSTAMRRLFALAGRVAASDVTVLIEGETGTGKDALCEAIHLASTRTGGPLIVVDCGAVPPNLFESELFGNEKGAFTGADRARAGAFEEADGGTLFLDELGELAPGVQPALLRALDKQSVRPVGGSTYTRASVRVVAATNRNLRAEIAARRFREDLYYRVAVVRMSIPPLRERPDDIPLLVQHFMRQFRGEHPLQVTREDLERLRRHDWMGNVRELRNVIERACAVSHGDRLEIEDALDDRPGASPAWATPGAVEVDLPFKEAKARVVEAFERDYIQALLKRYKGNLSAASRGAEIDRKHLRELLRKHGLRESSDS